MTIRILIAFAMIFAGTVTYAWADEPGSGCSFSEDTHDCQVQAKEFRDALPKANHGDYFGQRQVAFCYWTGCKGAIEIDLVQACTWETVIVSTNMSDVTDNFNFRQICGQLNSTDRNSANNAALALYGKIYKKLMTKPLPYEAPK